MMLPWKQLLLLSIIDCLAGNLPFFFLNMTNDWRSQVRDVSRGAGNIVRVTPLVTDFLARHRVLLLTKAFSQHEAASTGGTSRFCAAASAQQSAWLANWSLVYIIAKLTKFPALAACSRACREKETEVDNDLRIRFQSAHRTGPGLWPDHRPTFGHTGATELPSVSR